MLASCIAPAATPATVEPAPAPNDTPASAPTPAEEAASADTPDLAAVLEPTPACGDDDDEPTLAQTEGPYYTPNTPERTSLLEPGITGRNLLLSGFVLKTDCTPVARALVDFWHCDDAGVYDNAGYRLRGHQFTDEQGRYQLTTIVPGLYTGRTRHIHVKVQAPNQPVLTTQLYFPDEPANALDGIFHPSLVVAVSEAAGDADAGMNALFDFVLV
ncbi:MAG: intradiol ring-cleavage dioxygenase [Caldilineaceae bacterium]|nr:intradiol ring-cleavage dioxygenase [Caldilineaceae bacterium]